MIMQAYVPVNSHVIYAIRRDFSAATISPHLSLHRFDPTLAS
jgi:hypothetical protein